MTKQQADKWLLFLRGYGPVSKNENMYAETNTGLSKKYNIPKLYFKHPIEDELLKLIDPASDDFTNVILTGTAGDGKTTLCHTLWRHLAGDDTSIQREIYALLPVETKVGLRNIHFIFDFSSWAPAEGCEWSLERLDLLTRFAASVNGTGDDFFIIAANDGKLVQVWQELYKLFPKSPLAELKQSIEKLLAENKDSIDDKRLSMLNLSRWNAATLLNLAIKSLLDRPEWECFSQLPDDPAYGPDSPLFKNWLLLNNERFRARLCALVELCEANGFHIPIREIYLLLVNTLLGHPKVDHHVMKASDIRNVANTKNAGLAAAHRNLFGENLPLQKRIEYKVFSYLALFRVGEETSNEIENLILFGKEIPELHEDYAQLFESDPLYPINEEFNRLRLEYLGAEDFNETQCKAFLAELINERRRLFFRLPDDVGDTIISWDLTIFQSAGKYQTQVVQPLKLKESVQQAIVQELVKGFNRAWSGMLIDDGTHLHLTSGLDFTTARFSPIALHKISVGRNHYGEHIDIILDDNGRPKLVVHFFQQAIEYELTLLRFEFLHRISLGTLPNSFSRECYEDVVAFKSRLLATWNQISSSDALSELKIVELDDQGTPKEYAINL